MKGRLENGTKHPVSAHKQRLNNIHTIKKKRKENKSDKRLVLHTRAQRCAVCSTILKTLRGHTHKRNCNIFVKFCKNVNITHVYTHSFSHHFRCLVLSFVEQCPTLCAYFYINSAAVYTFVCLQVPVFVPGRREMDKVRTDKLTGSSWAQSCCKNL